MSSLNSASGPSTVAVVATYSDRWDRFGSEAARRALRAGARSVVVVDNGSACGGSIRAFEAEYPAGVVRVVSIGYNSGSAVAFGEGIRAGLAMQPEYLWLVDDDMWASERALTEQFRAIEAVRTERGADVPVVAVGARSDASVGDFIDSFVLRPYVFLGRDAFSHVLGRVARGTRARSVEETAAHREIEAIPYGGSLIPSSVIRAAGLPESRFVVYCDDFEWSVRLRREGAVLMACRSVLYEVRDRTFRESSDGGVRGFLQAPNTAMLHYRVRNEVAFRSGLDRTPLEELRFLANRLIWACVIRGTLIGRRWRDNRRAITRAIRHGLAHDFSLNPPLK